MPVSFNLHRLRRSLRSILLSWLLIALTLLFLYAITGHFAWQMAYFYVWLLGAGLPLWLFRRRIRVSLRKWKWPDGLKFVLLVYGMVLLEEVFAALFNHLAEGFSWRGYLIRIGQFWAFNLLAFTGLNLAAGFLFLRVGYTRWEMFVMVGLTGLYSEHILGTLWTSPLAFFVLAPIIFSTYGVIISPALLSVRPRRLPAWPSWRRYVLFFVVWMIITMPCILLLVLLRSRFPSFFPPTGLIP